MLLDTQARRTDQQVTLQYFKWEDKFKKQKPYTLLTQAPEGFPSVNHSYEAGPTETVEDAREREAGFTLDRHGFAIRSQELPTIDFGSGDVEKQYFPLVHQLIREECGPDAESIIFDWRVGSVLNPRRARPS
jgi:hypothetical protein